MWKVVMSRNDATPSSWSRPGAPVPQQSRAFSTPAHDAHPDSTPRAGYRRASWIGSALRGRRIRDPRPPPQACREGHSLAGAQRRLGALREHLVRITSSACCLRDILSPRPRSISSGGWGRSAGKQDGGADQSYALPFRRSGQTDRRWDPRPLRDLLDGRRCNPADPTRIVSGDIG